jgi:hypothetical protein
MKKIILIFLFLFPLVNASFGQELNCQVSINTSQIQGTVNKQIFDQLQRAIFEFMNNNKWTTETFAVQEKIDCSIFITIKEQAGSDQFSGTIQVTSVRPVFKSSYPSQILNLEDEKFQFHFQQFSQLEFNINTFQNNLTAVLAFYAYVIIANDYDTFAQEGGNPYWQKAQQIVNNAQSAAEQGWKSSESSNSQKNRYWLVENAMQPVFKGVRVSMYEYHRLGLDIMYDNPDAGRAAVLKALRTLIPVAQIRPASWPMQNYFQAKRDEVINIFRGGTPEEKTSVLEVLMTVDPAGTTKYSKIQG